MREIIIPSKRNNNGRRYGFVRFKEVKDTHHLAKQLDGIIIGGLKMYVNIPRYNREGPRQRETGNKLRDREDSNQVAADRIDKQHHTNQGSYAEALRRNMGLKGPRMPYNSYSQGHQSSMSPIHLNIDPNDTNWLKDAWVGRLTNPAMFDKIEDESCYRKLDWIYHLSIGDNLVLLLGLTDSGAEQLMNGGHHGGRPLFYTMEKWSPILCTSFRLTWVQVWGIPLQAWNLKYIRSILAAMGDMVEVDDDTEAKRRLDKARVLVKTPWRPIINHTVDVHISGENGESFKVFVVEESGGGSHDCRRRRCSLSGSSEEIVFDDSSLGHLTPRSSNS